MKTVYIALGSNLGDRADNLRQARERMESPDLHIARASSIYETKPRGMLDQPWFLNQVVEAQTALLPLQLLARLLKIEREMGRKRVVKNGPRLIDLDLLLYEDAVVSTPELEVPHPRMTERRFVLEPLSELAPELRLPGPGHPQSGCTMRELLAKVMHQPVRRQ